MDTTILLATLADQSECQELHTLTFRGETNLDIANLDHASDHDKKALKIS